MEAYYTQTRMSVTSRQEMLKLNKVNNTTRMYITDRNGKNKGIPNGVPTRFIGHARLPHEVKNDKTVAIHEDIRGPFVDLGVWMDREQNSVSTDEHVRQLYQMSARYGINTPEFLTAVIEYFDWREDVNPTYWENQPGHINEIIMRCAKGFRQTNVIDEKLRFKFTEEHAKQFAEDGKADDIVGDNGTLRSSASSNGGIPKIGDEIKYYRKEVREIGTKKNPKQRTIYYLTRPIQKWAYLYPPFMNEEFVRRFYDDFYMFASAKWKPDEDWVMELDNIVLDDGESIITPSDTAYNEDAVGTEAGPTETKGLDSIQSEVEAWRETKESDGSWDSMGDAERHTATTKKRRSIIRHHLCTATGLPIRSRNGNARFSKWARMMYTKSGITQTGVRWSVVITSDAPHSMRSGDRQWSIMGRVLMADMSGRGDQVSQDKMRNPLKESVFKISIQQLQAAYKKESRKYTREMRPPDGPIRLVVPSPEYAYVTKLRTGDKRRIQFAIYNPVTGLIEATKQKITTVVNYVLGIPEMAVKKPIKPEYTVKEDGKGVTFTMDATNLSEAGIEDFLSAVRRGSTNDDSTDLEEE